MINGFISHTKTKSLLNRDRECITSQMATDNTQSLDHLLIRVVDHVRQNASNMEGVVGHYDRDTGIVYAAIKYVIVYGNIA